MASVIDALVVTLGLDPSQFTEGQKKATESMVRLRTQSEQEAGKIEEQGKKAAQFFYQIRKAALELLTVFTAGVGTTEFLKFLTDSDAQLGRLAARWGVNAQALGAFGAASEALGGSAQTTENSIAGLLEKFEEIRVTGNTSILPGFRALGINLKAHADGTLNWVDALEQLHNSIAKMPKAEATTRLMGLGLDPGTITLLESSNFNALIAQFQKLQPSAADISAAERRQKAWEQLEQTWIKVGRTLATQVTPFLLQVATDLDQLAAWAAEHKDVLDVVFAGLIAVISAVSTAIIVQLIAGALTSLITIAPLVGTALTTAFGPIGVAVAGVAAIVASLEYLNKKYPQGFSGQPAPKSWPKWLPPLPFGGYPGTGEPPHAGTSPSAPPVAPSGPSGGASGTPSAGGFFWPGAYTGSGGTSSLLDRISFVQFGQSLARSLTGWGGAGENSGVMPAATMASYISGGLGSMTGGAYGTPSFQGASPATQQEIAYITRAALQRGIDPRVALAVARSEGLGGAYAGDYGSSFGPFQLHMGGLAGGGNAVSGLGDVFRQMTGLDPRDPANWRAEVDFALDWAQTHGWGAWHGWHGPAYAGIGAGAAVSHNNTSKSVTVTGPTTINTQATDAQGIAADYHAALKRTLAASDANQGFA